MKNIFLILLLASTTMAATKYLQGDAVKSLDLTKTWTMPAATDTLVGKATTDTLTNKTINADGTGNSITNIENADIKAAAAIALDKLAAVTASRVLVSNASGFVSATGVTSTEVGYVSGVTSAIQTQMDLKAPLSSPTFTGTVVVPATVTGAAAQVLTLPTTTGNLALNPMTTSGDITYGGVSGVETRLAKGADGTILTLASGLPTWAAPGAGFANPMTTGGDLIYGGASGVATRLANGSAGQLLQSNGSTNAPSWTTTLVAPTVSGDLTLSAGGIVFPATQVVSANGNTLDDYEEGTFTPTVSGITTAGAGTYSAQIGTYTKVGNVVTVNVRISITAHTGTGFARFGGLPFTSNSSNAAGSIGYLNLFALTASNVPQLLSNGSNTTAELYQMPAGGGGVTNVTLDTSFDIYYSLTYLAAN